METKRRTSQSILTWMTLFTIIISLFSLPVMASELKPNEAPCPMCGSYDNIEEIRYPTCTQDGGCFWICQSCGAERVMVGTPEWNALNQARLGHDYVDGVCSRCGEEDPNTKPQQGTEETEEEETACDHQWAESTTPATCAQEGSTIRTCQKCGAVETLKTYEKLEHHYQVTSETPATTQQEGVKVYTCDQCGDSYTETIEKLPEETCEHKWKYHSISATCTQEGSYFRDCQLCGEKEIIRTYEKKDHSYYRSEYVKPTTQQEGKSVYTCSRCGDSYTETIEKLPSTNENIPNNPTTTPDPEPDLQPQEPQKPQETVCSHSWSYENQKATCTQGGGYTRTCSKCGKIEKLSSTEALGHDYSSAVTKAATTTQEGICTYTCSRCGDQYEESIPKLAGTTETKVEKDPNAVATQSINLGKNAYLYYGYAASVMKSYLYQRSDGGVTRVECTGVQGSTQVVVEHYDTNYQLLSTKTIPMELPIFGGFYAGDAYNFLIFGQSNQNDDPNLEVVRVVKYSKDWERLGQASLMGANTYLPFDAGSLRCTEYNGMLYVHTAHEMFAGSDGVHHQANMIFSVRQSDMTVTDAQYKVSSSAEGYISHSFNQFVQVDAQGRLVTVNHGDFFPRALTISQYDLPAGQDEFVNYKVKTVSAMPFARSSGNYNYTGAWLGGFETTASHYMVALSSVPQSGDVLQYKTHNIMLSLTSQDLTQKESNTVQLTHYAEGGQESAGVPQLVKISDNKFFVVWDVAQSFSSSSYQPKGTIAYGFVDGKGNLISDIKTVSGYLSDCKPIVVNGEIVWYVTGEKTGTSTKESAPTFYLVEANSGTLRTVGIAGNTVEDTNDNNQSDNSQSSGSQSSGSQNSGSQSSGSQNSGSQSSGSQNNGSQNSGSQSSGSQNSGSQSSGSQNSGSQSSGSQNNATQGQSTQFSDVSRLHWGYSFITKASQLGLVEGFPDGTFRPETSVTAAQLYVMILNGCYPERPLDQATDQVWWEPYLQEAEELGLLDNTGVWEEYELQGQYGKQVDEPISRYEMAQVMYNVLKEQGEPTLAEEAQEVVKASIQDWNEIPTQYQQAVLHCYAQGLLEGTGTGNFDGGSPMTRAQACVVVTGLLEYMQGN